jgi:hypothetical protein
MRPDGVHPSRDRLLELFHVDLDAGLLFWRKTSGRARAGAFAGGLDQHGYLRVRFDGRSVAVHLCLWFLATGEWLPGKVDHHNRVRADNRRINLRLATVQQQRANATRQRNNTAGLKGVTVLTRGSRRFWARIKLKEGRVSLGCFSTAEQAAAAYARAAREHFGDFAHGDVDVAA